MPDLARSSEALKPKQWGPWLLCFPQTGYEVVKPEVIFKLEQGEEPWIGDGEVPSSDGPGGCENQTDVGRRDSVSAVSGLG